MRKLTDSWQLVQACFETSSMLQESIYAPPSSRKMDPILHLSNLRAKRYVFRDKCGELQMALRVNQMASLMPFIFFKLSCRDETATDLKNICNLHLLPGKRKRLSEPQQETEGWFVPAHSPPSAHINLKPAGVQPSRRWH